MLFSPGRQKTIDRATRPLAGDPHEEAIEKVRSISSVQRSSLFVYVKTWEIWRRAWKEICVQQIKCRQNTMSPSKNRCTCNLKDAADSAVQSRRHRAQERELVFSLPSYTCIRVRYHGDRSDISEKLEIGDHLVWNS